MEFLGNETERRGIEETKSEKIASREWEEHEEDVLQWIGSIFFHMYQEAGRSPGRFPRALIVARICTGNFPPPDFMFDAGRGRV